MKALRSLIVVIAIIVAVPFIGYVVWLLKKGTQMEVLVSNKSMINYKGSENLAFNYVLNSNKIFSNGKRRYHLKYEYIGLHWNDGDYQVRYPRLKDLTKTAEKVDLVYFADSKGIRKSDLMTIPEGESDRLEYGGVNNSDYTFCRLLTGSEKPIVIECSFLGPPTEPLVRYNMERITDVYYSGWIGKYVKDLSKEIEHCSGADFFETYMELNGEEWSFEGAGIVLYNEESGNLLVLQEGVDIDTKNGIISSSDEAVERFNLPSLVSYNGWFTLLHAGNNKVLSLFELNPTTAGMEKLGGEDLPDSFPAVIQVKDNVYFLAGDFGKCKVNLLFSRIAVINKVISAIRSSNTSNPSNFFYTFYQPFMNRIVEDAMTVKSNRN